MTTKFNILDYLNTEEDIELFRKARQELERDDPIGPEYLERVNKICELAYENLNKSKGE